MKNFFLTLFDRINITDAAGNLSISNLMLFAVVGKAIFTPALAVPDLIAILAATANYMHKRHENAKYDRAELKAVTEVENLPSMEEIMAPIKSEMSILNDKIGKVNMAVGIGQQRMP